MTPIEKANKKIEENKRTQKKELRLARIKIREIPKALSDCIWLESLNLSGTQLSEIKGLEQLVNLQKLYLHNTQLSEIKGLEQLVNLQTLHLSNTQLSEIKGLEQLVNLQTLNLSGTQLSEIKGLEQLVNLQTLNLSYTQLSEIKGLEQLVNLKGINLRNTQLSEIKGLEQLVNLKELDLRNTQLREIKGLEQLVNLKELDLKNTHLSEISGLEQLVNLQTLDLRNVPFQNLTPLVAFIRKGLTVLWTKEARYSWHQNEIRLFDNPLIHPSVEIVKEGNEAILNYFDSLKEGEETVYEARLIIIGEGGVGKTSLFRKLRDVTAALPDEDKDTTRGVSIYTEKIQQEGKEDFLMHIWDFGGQEVYHATHQLFLSNRALYILVLDGRKEEDPNYWLQVQDLLGEDSPVLMFLNKKGDIRENVAMQELSSFYPNLRKELATINLKEDTEGILKYQQTVAYHIRNLPHFQQGEKVPTKWVNIRKRLKEKAQEDNYLSIREFRKICAQEGISDGKKQLFVANFLHSLGAILHFSQEKLLKSMVILKPEWATGAVYKVLDHTAKKTGVAGKFLKSELEQVWSDLSYQDVFDRLLALMEKFELCYQLPGSREEYMVPKLMPNDHPGYTWVNEDQLQVQYHYTFMPKGIVTRLIVRLHELIEDQESVWKRGAKFQLRHTVAEVLEIYRDKQIHIKVKGNDRKELLGMIMREIDAINSTFDFGERLSVEKLLPCNCRECGSTPKPYFFRHSVIVRAREKGKKKVECQQSFLDVPIGLFLADIFDKGLWNREELIEILTQDGPKYLFRKIEAMELDEAILDRIMGQKARFNKLSLQIEKGDITPDKAETERNSIHGFLLNLIHEMDDR